MISKTVKKSGKLTFKVKTATAVAAKSRKRKTIPTEKITTVSTTVRKNKKTRIIQNRRRTPGAGRVKNTFDAALRKQYKQRAPVLYREKYKKINTLNRTLHSKQLQNGNKTEATERLQKSNVLLTQEAKQSYLSPRARVKIQLSNNEYGVGKFGFSKTTAKIIKRTLLSRLRQGERKTDAGNNGMNETLLQAALYRRRSVRKARDLRKLARRNKVTRTKTRPF